MLGAEFECLSDIRYQTQYIALTSRQAASCTLVVLLQLDRGLGVGIICHRK